MLTACRFDQGGVAPEDSTITPAPDGAVEDALGAVDARLDATPPMPDAAASPDAAGSDAGIVAGGALRFDGNNDRVGTARQVAGNFTIEAWIQTASSRSGTQHYQGLSVVHADVAGNNDDFGTAILNDHFAFGTGNPDLSIESTTVVTTGAWFHVAAVREGSTGTIRLYVNGVMEAAVNTGNTSDLDAATTITIGGNPIDSRYFAGTIDEVRIWATARTGAQIADNMNLRLQGDEGGLVNDWRFDEGAGTTTSDHAGGNTGELGSGSPTARPLWITSDAPIF